MMQPRPDSILGTTHHPCYFVHPQPLDFKKYEDRSFLRIELVEHPVEQMQLRRPLGRIDRRGWRRLAQGERAEELPNPAPAPQAYGVATSDPIDPGRKLGLAAEARQAAIDRHEHVLRGVLALLGRDTKGADEAVD